MNAPWYVRNVYLHSTALGKIYKLLERLMYNRLSEVILGNIPVEQAGFRSGTSCTDQVLALTTYIEAASGWCHV